MQSYGAYKYKNIWKIFLNERVAEGDNSDPYDFNTGGGVLD